MITGRMAMATIMYTLPISNFRKSALRSCAIRMGWVFLNEIPVSAMRGAGDFVLLDLFFERLEIRILHIY